jgi:uncharacterized protein YkuJ
MSIFIGSRNIDKVCVIDDDEDFRSELEETITDANLSAVPQELPIQDAKSFLDLILDRCQAVVSDHNLMQRGRYFPVNGAEFVSMCYSRRLPALLITRIEQPNSEIRRYRRNIPVVVNPEEFDPEVLIHSLDICLQEFDLKFAASRKPWRTLIRVDEVDGNNINVIIPGWDQNEKIAINMADLPFDIQKDLYPDKRMHAKVNIGAECRDELYFFDWENK